MKHVTSCWTNNHFIFVKAWHRRRNGGAGGASAPPLFSEKAVNIINTYTFILGAKYFSPPTFCMLPPPLHGHMILQWPKLTVGHSMFGSVLSSRQLNYWSFGGVDSINHANSISQQKLKGYSRNLCYENCRQVFLR